MYLAQFEIKESESLKPYFEVSEREVNEIEFKASKNKEIKFIINENFDVDVFQK